MDSERAPWIIGGAIVIAGLLIAIAVYLSRAGEAEVAAPVAAPSAPAASNTPPASSAPQPPPADVALDAAAQRNLRNALRTAEDLAADSGSFTGAGSLEMSEALPELTYQPSVRPSTRSDALSVANNPTSWAAAALSESGACYWIKAVIGADGSETVVTYGSGTPCSGNAAMLSATLPDWKSV